MAAQRDPSLPTSTVLHERLLHRPASTSPTAESAPSTAQPLLTGPSDWIIPPAFSLGLIWFFPLPADRPSVHFMAHERMAAALERLLLHYPPAAGRLVRGERGRINIDCAAHGVPFVVAESACRIADLPLSASEYTDTRCMPGSLKLVAEMDVVNAIQAPLLQVQHTRMGCGGVALGIRMSHILVDGEALFTFVHDWAELYSSGGAELRIPPSLDRSWTIPTDEQLLQCPVEMDREEALTMGQQLHQLPPSTAASPSIIRVFRFSRAALTALKTEATGPKLWVSTYEALTAWLLQRLYAARVSAGTIAEDELDRPMKLIFACNWRPRLHDPTPPPKYWGNGTVQLSLRMPLRVLLHNPLSTNAARLHDAVHDATAARIRATFAFIAGQADVGRLTFNIDPRVHVSSTSWSRMGMYRVVFDGASPLRICLPYFAGVDGITMLHSAPGKEAGTESDELDAYIGSSEAVMQCMVMDAEWQRVLAL